MAKPEPELGLILSTTVAQTNRTLYNVLNVPPKQTQSTNEKEHSEKTGFKENLEGILDRSLTPGNVEAYADDALQDLVTLADKVTSRYKATHDELETPLATENAAFEEYGLGNVQAILDHILQLSSTLKNLDNVIRRVDSQSIDEVMTPPDIARAMIFNGPGEFVKRLTLPRLKTILFVLKNDFGIDPEVSDEITITKGSVRPDMMRREGYYSIELENLRRTVLVCDEEGNATFVFDTQKLSNEGILYDDLIHKTKDELIELIDTLPGTGTRIIYSEKTFIADVSNALSSENALSDIKKGKYLESIVPEGFLVTAAIATKLGVAQRSVTIAIGEIIDELDPIRSKVRSTIATFYSPNDQEKITARLDQKGILFPRAGEDQWSVLGMSKDLNASRHNIDKAIQALKSEEKLGVVGIAKFNSYVGAAYDSNQKELIEQWLKDYKPSPKENEAGKKVVTVAREEIILEGYRNHFQFAKELGIGRDLLEKIVTRANAEIGDVLKLGNQWMYSPTQQEIVARRVDDYKEQREEVEPLVLDGYKSRVQLRDEWGIHVQTIQKAIDALGGEMGDVLRANRSSNPTDVFSPTQQETVYKWLEENNFIANKVPDGYVSLGGMSTKLGFGGEKVILSAINELGDALGEVSNYKNYSRITAYYSPEQQGQIREWITHNLPNSRLAQSAISATYS